MSKKRLFPLGDLYMTPGAIEAFHSSGDSVSDYINRHVTGDWGDLCHEDKKSNQEALEHGFRIFSAYHLSSGEKIWIITEADRSITTVLLPEEY